MNRRKIAVVTGSRADYGLLRPLLTEIAQDPELELLLLVTGMHWSPAFGSTYTAILADGFAIDAHIETQLSSDSALGMAKSVGLGVIGFADALARLQPDLVVVLGDRYEILAAAQAALLLNLPLAHVHGGELTLGAIDDAIRHSITKMAHLHFVAAEDYRRRVMQMGEAADRVFTVGALGLDNFRTLPLLTRPQLVERLGLPAAAPWLLITYHPETLAQAPQADAIAPLLAALDHFPDAHLLFTKANADSGGHAINGAIERYQQLHGGRVSVHASLGQLVYLSVLSHADVVVGNSSSGILEAPFAKTPCVNIGSRQEGRIRSGNIIDCADDATAIRAAIERALSAEFRAVCAEVNSVYGDGTAASRIKQVLKQVDLRQLRVKRFCDWPAADCDGRTD